MIESLALLALLHLVDPVGDAHGDGSLLPPTAPVHASLAPYDLVEAWIEEAPTWNFAVRLAGIPDPGNLPNGFTLPVLDLYLDLDAEGGVEATLPGPGMVMPPGRGWDLAIRATGDYAYARLASDLDGDGEPVLVERVEDVLYFRTELPRPEGVEIHDLQVLTGVYDPFSETGWRPVASGPSPFAFGSLDGGVRLPVVDLLAADDAAQREALTSGVLPVRARTALLDPWFLVMGFGMLIALLGVAARFAVASERAPVSPATLESSEGGDAVSEPEPAGQPASHIPPAAEAVEAAEEAPPVPLIGRAGRKAKTVPSPAKRTPPAPPASSGLAASEAFRGDPSDAEQEGGEARRLPTTWAEGDGWWLEDPDEEQADDDEAREVWSQNTDQSDEVTGT